jgi:acid-sensing ion channel, other
VTAVAQVCDPELFSDIDPKNKTNCDHCAAHLEYTMGQVPDVLAYCHLFPTDTCENMFKKVTTEGGVCFTFNGLEVLRGTTNDDTNAQIVNWTLDDGYRTNNIEIHADLYPRSGTSSMLSLVLTAFDDMKDGLCKGPIKGFNVYLHLPNETPQISKHYYSVPYQQVVQISISPNMIVSEVELRDLPIEKRQCYFNDERYLRFFRYYTQNNCEVECVANLTVKECGCQRFHMPGIYELSG